MNRRVIEAIIATVTGAVILALFSVIHTQGKALSVSQESQRTQAQAVLELKDTIKDMYVLMRGQAQDLSDLKSQIGKNETEIKALRRDVDRLEGTK